MENHVFVAREGELARLEHFLQQAMDSNGNACFVTGEAGSGKTALVTEFSRRAQEKYADLAVAVGQSDVQTGITNAHLPFREVLGQLTGDVETKLAQGAITRENAGRLRKLLALSGQALVDIGPDLIGVFVPGVGLATRVGAFVAEKAGWLQKLEKLAEKEGQAVDPAQQGIEQSHIFEQYANVLCRLSDNQPLLIVLDDLQWADDASISLLFRLARRVGNHRILIIGTYRPEEVAIGRAGERHPLEKVLAELKRYYGDTRVDLDRSAENERSRFINEMLDTEPNRLGADFRRKLFEHTDGHPLFTIELLRSLQESGDLVQNSEGCWVQTPGLAWGTIPDRVEGIIEERIGRLEKDLHEILTIGSVEGEDFTAEVVSRVLLADIRTQIQKLSTELDKQHRLVHAKGGRRLPPSGQRISQYRFQHNLIRTYLYMELDETQRAYLHEDVGSVLEELYGDQVDEILVQLAAHFDQAGIVDKAIPYLRRAGEQAARRFANAEAAQFFSRALALMPETEALTGQPGQLAEHYQLHLAREDVFARTGNREAQRRDLDDLCRLAETLANDARRAEVSLREARYAEMTGEYTAALIALQDALRAARSAGDIPLEARALRGMGYILWRKGDYKESRIQSQKALDLARSHSLKEVEAGAMQNMSVALWRMGEMDEARSVGQQCKTLSLEIGDRRTFCSALSVLGNIALGMGEFDEARSNYEACLKNETEMGDRRGQAMAQGNLGIIAEIQGDFSSAVDRFRRVREIFNEMGDRNSEARALAHIGLNANLQGDFTNSRSSYEAALEMYREIGDRQGQAWVQTMLCRLFVIEGDLEPAEALIREALDMFQKMGVQDMEASAWIVLAHVQESSGEYDKAAAAYQKGLDMFVSTGNESKGITAVAGLARVALAQGDRKEAGRRAHEIWQLARQEPIRASDDEPFAIYLSCYQVLRAVGDPEAGEVLHEAYRQLMYQAARISDPDKRQSFLENVPFNREIVQAFTETC